ncbi:MAG: AmmeMemoRadiSam system protein B [Ignavibacteria bacterium]
MLKRIRKPYCAGSWYPKDKLELTETIDRFLRNVPKEPFFTKAIIVPHAGYMFSGQTAAYSFRQLDRETKEVIILGAAHRYYLIGASFTDYDYYETPLGLVKVTNKSKTILKENVITSIEEADYQEHSIELEIPFLQRVLNEFSIIPIIVGKVSPEKFSDFLEKYHTDEGVIVVSVDLSHFHPYEEAKRLDEYSINCILNLDYKGIDKAEIDSPFAVESLLMLAKKQGWKTKLLNYRNSGDVISDKSSVVGYAAIAFYVNDMSYFTESDRRYMEKLAKEAVEVYIRRGKKIDIDNPPENLKRNLACFVTIKDKNNLRGCIGTTQAVSQLYKGIIDNAICAATRDWRFEPVKEYELPDLKYEVSVLSEPREYTFLNTSEMLKTIIGKGVIIEKGINKAVYLPQVWEHFTKPEDFITSLCLKAGLKGDEWRLKGIKYYLFELL